MPEVPPTHTSAGTEPPLRISPYHLEFANLELARPLEYYERRINAIGFTGMNRVLDAACGIGQWSLALGLHNDEVHGIDRVEERLALAESIVRTHGRRNVHFTHGDVEALPYADAWFDAVFCYGVLMFLDQPTAFAEFQRVLKPGGRLYVSANGIGWSLYLALGRRLYRPAWNTIRRTLRQETRDVFLTRRRVDAVSASSGFRIDAWGGEGKLRAAGRENVAVASVYRSRFLGFQAVWEMLATTLGHTDQESRRLPVVDPAGFLRDAQAYDSPRHVVSADVVGIERPADGGPPVQFSPAKLERLKSEPEDRAASLAGLAQHLTQSASSTEQRVETLIRFCQDAIYHNPIEQPPLNLEAFSILELGEGRCGHVTEVLVALLRAVGLSARSRQLRDHVVAEFFHDRVWRIADADAFKNGIIPRGGDGQILSMRELEENPYLIDRYQPSGWWMQPDTHYLRNAAGVPVSGYVDALPPERRGFLSNYYAWWVDRRYPPSIPRLHPVNSPLSRGTVRLSWSASSDPDGDLRGYTVRVGSTSRGWSYDAAVYERLTTQTGTDVACVETPETSIQVAVELPGRYFWSVSAFDAHRELEPETFYWSSDEGSFEVR